MDDQLADLIPLTAQLADQYTSLESSSVTYETAQMLLAAVWYSISQCFSAEQGMIGAKEQRPPAKVLYEQGRNYLIEKVLLAKQIYQEIIIDFEDYQCRNYQDTVLNGMPEFFRRYDIKFCPQEHLLTLDYPLLGGNPPGTGIDLILAYLQGTQLEQSVLKRFARNQVIVLLDEIIPDYQELYFDNLCEPVLLQALGCVVAERPIQALSLECGDREVLVGYFGSSGIEQIETKVRAGLDQMLGTDAAYVQKAARDMAARIRNAIILDHLEQVWFFQ